MIRTLPALLALLAPLAACTPPDLPPARESVAARAPYPGLLPLDQLAAPAATPDPTADLAARAAALRARAAALRAQAD